MWANVLGESPCIICLTVIFNFVFFPGVLSIIISIIFYSRTYRLCLLNNIYIYKIRCDSARFDGVQRLYYKYRYTATVVKTRSCGGFYRILTHRNPDSSNNCKRLIFMVSAVKHVFCFNIKILQYNNAWRLWD